MIPPSELEAERRSRQPMKRPSLPNHWRASVLLSPFGDGKPPMRNHSQLCVADISYRHAHRVRVLRCRLHLLEDLTYFDWLFVSGPFGTRWYWLVGEPGRPITGWYGPFDTPLEVPEPDFLVRRQARFGNAWSISGIMTDGWVVPTDDPPTRGSWFSFRRDNARLMRLLNIDCGNPLRMPVLGAFFLANVAEFTASTSPELEEICEAVASAPQGKVALDNPLATQRDIQAAIADPLSVATCTIAQIQSLIPGLSPPPARPPGLPQWTDKTFIQGWSIGLHCTPYYTEIHYWWARRRQRSMFVGWGPGPGQGTYFYRLDMVLYADYTTLPAYEWKGQDWEKVACLPCTADIGVPRPDFADMGKIKATIEGNKHFGLEKGRKLFVIAAEMPRDQDTLSIFWLWFTDDQKGVLFSECEIAQELKHALQVIDYVVFDQNADTHVDDTSFADPCYVPACTGEVASAVEMRLVPVIMHRPAAFTAAGETG
jgi:hypothetical protein